MQHSSPVEALYDGFLAIQHRTASLTAADLDSIRRRVRAVVQDLRDRGAPAERIVVAVRHIAQDAGVVLTGHPRLDAVVQWCVEEYYTEPDRPTRSSVDTGWVGGGARSKSDIDARA